MCFGVLFGFVCNKYLFLLSFLGSLSPCLGVFASSAIVSFLFVSGLTEISHFGSFQRVGGKARDLDFGCWRLVCCWVLLVHSDVVLHGDCAKLLKCVLCFVLTELVSFTLDC